MLWGLLRQHFPVSYSCIKLAPLQFHTWLLLWQQNCAPFGLSGLSWSLWVLWSTQLAEISSFLCVCVYLLIFGIAPWLRLLSWVSAHGQGSSACPGQAKNGGHWCQGRLGWTGRKSQHRNQLARITFDTSHEGSCVRGRGTAPWDWEMFTCAAVTHPRQLPLDILPFLSSQTRQMPWLKLLFLLWFFLTAPARCAGLGMGLAVGYFQR